MSTLSPKMVLDKATIEYTSQNPKGLAISWLNLEENKNRILTEPDLSLAKKAFIGSGYSEEVATQIICEIRELQNKKKDAQN